MKNVEVELDSYDEEVLALLNKILDKQKDQISIESLTLGNIEIILNVVKSLEVSLKFFETKQNQLLETELINSEKLDKILTLLQK